MAGLDGFPGFIKDIVQGTTRDFVIEITRDIFDVDGNVIGEEPVDLTGSKFYVTFDYDREVGTTPALEILLDPPSDPLEGRAVGKVSDDQSMVLSIGNIFYSVRWITAGGDTYPIDLAKIKILAGVSDRRD